MMLRKIFKGLVLKVGIVCYLVSTTAIMPVFAQQNNNRAEFPGRRVGGGTRGECLAGSQPLVALNPVNNLALTASDRPSVYFIVPKLDQGYPVEFILEDADGNEVYQTTLEAGTKEALLGIDLPQNTLQLDQDYHWYLSMICDIEDSSQNVVLEGWLRKVTSDVSLTSNVGVKDGLAQVQSYQNAGLWSDAIATLISLRQTYPDNSDVLNQWTKLLQQLELEEVIGEKLASQL